MIEDLLLKAAFGHDLKIEEIEQLENCFKKNPDLIEQYIEFKNFIRNNNKNLVLSDSIFIFKENKTVFSTILIQKQEFKEVKAASISNHLNLFKISFDWNNLSINIESEIDVIKLTLKSIKENNEILLKNSEKELFHLELSESNEFVYDLNESNYILSNNGINLGIFVK